jgi:hypothetical protein
MHIDYSLPCNPFDVWGFDFIGHSPPSNGHIHVLLEVDYVTKWVEEIPTRSVDYLTMMKMLKDVIFPKLGVPRYL